MQMHEKALTFFYKSNNAPKHHQNRELVNWN